MLGTSKQKTGARPSNSGENCWTLKTLGQNLNLRILPIFFKQMLYPREDSTLAMTGVEGEQGSHLPSTTQKP